MPQPVSKLSFTRAQRLTRALEFQRVFAHKLRKTRGVITVFARPNGLGHDRLGLSIGKKVGGAVVRGRAKKLIREAFRLSKTQRNDLLGHTGYDLLVSTRPHEGYASRTLKADEIQSWLLDAALACHREQIKRDAKRAATLSEQDTGDV